METSGTFIKNKRLAKGYSQEKLAKLCGVYPQCISLIETNKTKHPVFSTLKSICSLLDIDLCEALKKFDYNYISELDNITLGSFIKNARLAKGYSQEKLAKLCDLSIQCIHCIETGKQTPQLFTLTLIFSVLDINLSETLAKFDYINESNNITLGGFIKNARLAKGYTQQILADLCVVSIQTIILIETGKVKKPTLPTLTAICSTLDIDLNKALEKMP